MNQPQTDSNATNNNPIDPAVPAQVKKRGITRRKMLTAVGVLAASGAVGSVVYSRNRDPINVALIGAGIRGDYHAGLMKWLSYGTGQVGNMIAVCDVDEKKAKATRDRHWPGAIVTQDFRRVLENKDVEAVFIATPDHWHTGIAIDAIRAGKAVYVEKPVSLTVQEGFRLREVAKEHNAVVQVGTQQRSHLPFHQAWELVNNGRLGQLKKVVVNLSEQPPISSLSTADAEPPSTLDWDLWLGPTAADPYSEFRRNDWHHIAEYTTGMIGNWGSHHLDIALWATGNHNRFPVKIEGQGTIQKVPLGTGTPSAFNVSMEYPDGLIVEMKTAPNNHGIFFEGDEGQIFVNRGRVSGKPVEELAKRPLPPDAKRVQSRFSPGSRQKLAEMQHYRDFYASIRGGGKTVADVDSSVCVHTALNLASISIQLGRAIRFDSDSLQVIDDPDAMAMTSRTRRPEFEI